jgi:hypothetical protein
VLEVHPPHRPEPVTLASVTEELLAGRHGAGGVTSNLYDLFISA